jgi:ammonium transporter, Amt family
MEYGICRKGFGAHLAVKNFVQFSLAVTSYWLIGFAFSFGNTKSNFIGQNEFGGDQWVSQLSFRCFSYSVLVGIFIIFIVNCAITERVQYASSIIFSVCLMIFVWPVIVAWTWGNGWLQVSMPGAIIDLGGSITVYTFAGAFAFIASLIAGPREGRFSQNEEVEQFKMVNHESYIIGSMLTILGCLGIGFSQQSPTTYGYAMANMWICGSVSSIIALKVLTFLSTSLERHYLAVYQGFIAGMVFISSASANTTPWESGLHGLMSGCIFSLGVFALERVKIDDVLNITSTFLLPGIFGGVLPGFIDNKHGVYWGGSNSGQVLGTQVVGTLTIMLWSMFWSAIVFGTLKVFGMLVVNKKTQISGLSKTGITQKGYVHTIWMFLSS